MLSNDQVRIMEKKALFCYGTLQSPLVMKAVTGHSYNGQEAILNNWARFRVRGSEYPGIIRKEESSVTGKVYWDLDEPTMEKLDAFEGEKYERVIIQVTMADGTNMDAWAYAIKDDCRKMLSDDPWDFDRFMQYGLEKFIHWFVEDRRDLFDRGDF
ncbi:MAG: gamma-glutamylcyclotransferase family protein [Desulfobulbus sp.]